RRYRKTPLRLADTALPALVAYGWPGNVRELENTIERAVVMSRGDTIGIKDLRLRSNATSDSMVGIPPITQAAPPVDAIALPPGLSLEEAERRYARAILDREGGNQSAAARALGISRNKLARLLRG